MKKEELKPCPFCGMQSNSEWEDTLYPSGVAYRDDLGVIDDVTPFRHYVRYDDYRGYHGLCYEINCAVVYGGCGVNITGDSKEEVIGKWNSRVK